MKSATTSESSGEYSYDMDLPFFCDMMSASNLSKLAGKEVFDLFSPNSRGEKVKQTDSLDYISTLIYKSL